MSIEGEANEELPKPIDRPETAVPASTEERLRGLPLADKTRLLLGKTHGEGRVSRLLVDAVTHPGALDVIYGRIVHEIEGYQFEPGSREAKLRLPRAIPQREWNNSIGDMAAELLKLPGGDQKFYDAFSVDPEAQNNFDKTLDAELLQDNN